jgi:hypothetical protein
MPTEEIGTVPPEILWNERAREVYEHGASESAVDHWQGAPAEALLEKLEKEEAALDLFRAKVATDVAYIADADSRGEMVMVEYREGVAQWQRLVAINGFRLYMDRLEIERLQASRGIED